MIQTAPALLRALVFSFVVLCLTSASRAAIIETEPNDTLATADVITRASGNFSDTGLLFLASGDVDVFSLDLLAGEALTAVTVPLSPPVDSPDTELAIVDPSGVIVAADDDGGPGLGSTGLFIAPTAGTYYIAVTGFNDITNSIGTSFAAEFDGNHFQSGVYQLIVGVVSIPEPSCGVTATAALGLLVARRRRRQLTLEF